MAAIPTSPAVVYIEKDNSAYPPNINSSIVGIVGYATKGPGGSMVEPTLITSQEQLLRVFGNPQEALPGQGLEGALEILETTNQVRYVRAVPTDATNASATVTIGSCPAVVVNPNDIGTDKAGLTNYYFTISVKDSAGVTVLDPTTYTVASGTTIPSATAGQASGLARVLGDGSNPSDKFGVYWNKDSTGSITGFDYGAIVGSWAGKDATISVSAFSGATLSTKVGALILQALGASGQVLGSAASSVTARGYNVSTGSVNYLAQALYKGTGYDLGTDTVTGQTSGLSIEIDTVAGPEINLSVNENGIVVENFKVGLTYGTTFVENVINIGETNLKSTLIMGELSIGGSTSSTPNAIDNFYDKMTDLKSTVTAIDYAGTSFLEASPRFVKFVENTYNMTGGTNGTMTNTATIIGNAATKTGIYALDDDALNISVAIVPGFHDDEVQNNLITLAETTQNFIAVVSPPNDLPDVQAATDWMNGKGSHGRTSPINSSWGAVFWPHVQVFNTFEGKDMWYDPAIFAVRQMTYTDNVAETWFAPAGFRRGRLTKPTATEMMVNQGDRDSLYVNNINPVVNFNPEGITIFGQKTAQRAATALDRINVRRLMIYLRKTLLQTGRIDLFEPNDAFTWEQIKSKADSVLSDIQNRRGIADFQVVCDSTVNTPLRVDRNELWCKILLKPTKTAEWIIFEVNLTSQSAKFNG
jgi:phage tail sheath protein FI